MIIGAVGIIEVVDFPGGVSSVLLRAAFLFLGQVALMMVGLDVMVVDGNFVASLVDFSRHWFVGGDEFLDGNMRTMGFMDI